eukprot:jgi/Tetstr1/455288/TSEL_042124.t1
MSGAAPDRRGGAAPQAQGQAQAPLGYGALPYGHRSGQADTTLATLTAAAMSAMMLNMEPPASNMLHHAARRGRLEEFEALLVGGADISAVDSEGRTCLHHAVLCGHLPICEAVLRRPAAGGLLLAKDLLSCTPFHLAAVQNQVQFILCLVKALAKENNADTPLHYIASRCCMQDLMGFLHLGWDAEVRAEVGGHGPVSAIAPLPSGPGWEAVRVVAGPRLLDSSGFIAARAILRWAPVHWAAMEGEVGLLQRLLDAAPSDLHARSANSWTPLHYAAANNRLAAIEALAARGADLAAPDAIGYTPLHVAAGEGHTAAMAALVRLGTPPGARDRDGCTAIFSAVAWNRCAVVAQLEELGCPGLGRSSEHRSPVHVAAEQGWAAIIPFLVRTLGNSVDAKDSYASTPSHAAANWGWPDALSSLLALGANPGLPDYLGRTPLHYAALHGRCAALRVLTAAGAPLDARDSRGGLTPLHLAADAGQCDAIAALAAAGAALNARNDKGLTPLGLATAKGPINVDAIGLLADLGADVNCLQEQKNQELPLHVAARSGRVDVMGSLLRAGADTTLRTRDGSTALHYAAAFGQAGAVEVLVGAGCSVHWRDNASNTPLHLAAGCGFLDTCQVLSRLGADLMARDVSQCTPLHNAAHGTYSALAAMPAGTGAAGMLPGTAPPMRLGGLPGAGRQPAIDSALALSNLASSFGLAGDPTAGAAAASGAVGAPVGGAGGAGLVPVRTGLAWAALSNSDVGSMCMFGEEEQRPLSNWRGLELLQLLKKTTRARRQFVAALGGQGGAGGQAPPTTATAAAAAVAAVLPPSPPVMTAADLTNPAGAASDALMAPYLQSAAGGMPPLPHCLSALSSQFSGMEQDRSRLTAVAQCLVDLGAGVSAVDNEGRTALHLAAGCGDRDMVKKLVELGGDINALDHMGGTAMHHAAMANKKDMMFTLARMGCDWRTRADGIDGATAAYVLCGQHGKTSRQQKLLEAKLKRMAQEGDECRRLGKPLSGADGDTAAEITSEVADANMAALLEEETEEKERQKDKKKAKAKKKKAAKAAKAAAPVEAASPAAEEAQGAAPPNGDEPKKEAEEVEAEEEGKEPPVQEAAAGEAVPLEMNGQPAEGMSAPQRAEGRPTEVPPREAAPEDSEEVQARVALEEAVTRAQTILEIGVATGLDVIAESLEQLDGVIARAVGVKVSAKYAKKVRKRLEGLVEELQPTKAPPPPPAAPRPAVARPAAPTAAPKTPASPRRLPAPRTAYHPMAQRAPSRAPAPARNAPPAGQAAGMPAPQPRPPWLAPSSRSSSGGSMSPAGQGANPPLGAAPAGQQRAAYAPVPRVAGSAAAASWSPLTGASPLDADACGSAACGWLPLGAGSSDSLFRAFQPTEVDAPPGSAQLGGDLMLRAGGPGGHLPAFGAPMPSAPVSATSWGMSDGIWGGFGGLAGTPQPGGESAFSAPAQQQPHPGQAGPLYSSPFFGGSFDMHSLGQLAGEQAAGGDMDALASQQRQAHTLSPQTDAASSGHMSSDTARSHSAWHHSRNLQ